MERSRLRGRSTCSVLAFFLAAGLCQVLPTVAADLKSSPGKRLAVIIGVDHYAAWPELQNAVADARDVAEVLKSDFGFETTFLPDPMKASVTAALGKDLKQKLGPKDTLVVFFAGHGDFRDGAGYLAASDSPVATTPEGRDGCVRVSRLREAVAQSGAGSKLVILDCCFSGALFDPTSTFSGDLLQSKPLEPAAVGPLPRPAAELPPSARSLGPLARSRRELETPVNPQSFVGLTAGKFGPVPDEGAGLHSPFTEKLLKQLRERADTARQDHVFTFEELAFQVKKEVAAELEGRIVPAWGRLGDEGGEFLFVPLAPDKAETPSERRHRQKVEGLLQEAYDSGNRWQSNVALERLREAQNLDAPRRPWLAGLRRQQVEAARGLCSRPRYVWTHPPFPDRPPSVFTPQEIYDAVFHPTEETAATAGADAQVRFWDVRTGKPQGEPLRNTAPVRTLVYSPDGNRLAAGLDNGRVAVWDLRTRTALDFAEIAGSALSVTLVDFSTDGKRVLAADVGHVRILDISSGKVVFQIPYVVPVAAARFSPDGTKVVVAATTGSARVWDVDKGEPVGPLLRHGGHVNDVAFRPDGAVVATAGEDGNLKFWNPFNGTEWESTVQISKPIRWVDYAPGEFGKEGPFVVIGDGDGNWRRYVRNRDNVYLWDRRPLSVWPISRHRQISRDWRFELELAQGAVVVWDQATRLQPALASPTRGTVEAVTFTRDGSRLRQTPLPPQALSLLSARRPTAYALQQWELRSNAALSSDVPGVSSLIPLALTPDALRLVGVKPDRKTAEVWNLDTGKREGCPLLHPDEVFTARFSADGRRVMTTCIDDTHRFWSVAAATLVGRPWKVHKATNSTTGFSPTGETAFDWSGGTLRTWDVDRGAELPGLLLQALAQPVYTPEGRVLLVLHVGAGEATLSELDVRTGWPLLQYPLGLGGQDLLQASQSVLAISPDGRHAAYGGPEGTLAVWPRGDPLALTTLGAGLINLPGSPNLQNLLLSVAGRCLNGATRSPPVLRQVHKGSVAAIAFSPDGRRLATVSLDHSARVWDVETGEGIMSPVFHRGPVLAGTFSPDGRYLATVAANEQSQLSLSELRARLLRGSGQENRQGIELIEHDRDALAGSQDKTVRVWNLEGNRTQSEDVGRDLDGLLTLNVVAEDGDGSTSASAWQLARMWRRTQQDFPGFLNPNLSQEISWHLQAYLDCEATRNRAGRWVQTERLVALDSSEWMWHVLNALRLYENGKGEDAVLALDRAGTFPAARGDPYYWKKRGEVLKRMNRLEPAVDAFREAIQYASDDWSIYSELAGARLKQKEWAKAAAAYREAVGKKPPADQLPILQYQLGIALAEQNTWSAAMEAFDTAEKVWPGGDPPPVLSDINILHVQQAGAIAALGGGDLSGYHKRCKKIADEYVNTTNESYMVGILWLLALEPVGDPKVASPFRLPLQVYMSKLRSHEVSSLNTKRWGRYVKGLYFVWQTQPGRGSKVDPKAKWMFDRMAQEELTATAPAGVMLRFKMLLAVLMKRAGFADEAAQWERKAQESLPEGWEKELTWLDRIQLSSVRTSFEREFPHLSK